MEKKKRVNHILPVYYLKGFCEPGSSFVWVFRRGQSYRPGVIKDCDNPYRSRPRKTAKERDRNTVTNPDGTRDFNTFENAFQRIETKADKPLAKVRARELVTQEDKEKLARYIGLMLKRVDKRKEIFDALLDKHLVSLAEDRVARELAYQGHFRSAYDMFNVAEYLRSQECMKYLFVRSGAEPFKIVHKAIMEMRWEFVMAPSNKYFVTSDNPVIYDTHFGLKRSPLFFPIDQRTALIATWYGENDLPYIEGSSEQVLKVNSIIIAMANTEVYAHTPDKSIHQALEDGVLFTT